MNPGIFWRQNFSRDTGKAIDALRIIASYDIGGSVFEAACAVSDSLLLHPKLLTLLWLVQGHVGVLSNREAARHAVSAIESGEW